jgi:hypothetical protein
VKRKNNKCEWIFDHINNEKNYMKCKYCGRVKREDIPDVQPCVGSSSTYRTMIFQVMGHDLSRKDIEDIEKDDTSTED